MIQLGTEGTGRAQTPPDPRGPLYGETKGGGEVGKKNPDTRERARGGVTRDENHRRRDGQAFSYTLSLVGEEKRGVTSRTKNPRG